MAVYDAHSKEVLLYRYKNEGRFEADRIINNDLNGIDLSKAVFTGTGIEGSSLARAQLRETAAERLAVQQCDLCEADFTGSRQQTGQYTNSYLIKTLFCSSRLYDMRFEKCIAHSVDFSSAALVCTGFSECEMYKSKFRKTLLMKTVFRAGNKGDLAGLAKSTFAGALVIDCGFAGINLNQVEIEGAVFIRCDFSRAQLEGVDYNQARFIACTFDHTVLAPGTLL